MPRKMTIKPAEVQKLYEAGLTKAQIARQQGVSPSAISRYLVNINNEAAQLELHRAKLIHNELYIHAGASRILAEIIDSMDKEYIASLKPSEKNGLAMAMNATRGTAFDKYRLESGQSTENHNVLVQAILEVKKRKVGIKEIVDITDVT